jgi:16S rRNA G966 N2-methylase RsmD
MSLIQQLANDLNLSKTDYKIHKSDVIAYLKNTDKTYNIIFSDAPYNLRTASKIVQIVSERKLLSSEGFLILETENTEQVEINPRFTLVKEKVFGISKLTVLEFSNEQGL